MNKNKLINYAHRGASAYAPENTMSSFELALELKATGIELDLQKTKDNKIVIFHDKKIDKKSSGSGRISDYTYEQLLQFDFGSWFNKKYAGEKIVLFENFAKQFLSKKLFFAIELKVSGIEYDVLNIIKKYSNFDNIYITSFDYQILYNVRKINHDVKLGWLIEDNINNDNITKALNINCSQICPNAQKVSKEEIKLANASGLAVRLWGVVNEDVMKKCYKLDIEGMTVNFPDKLNDLIN